MNHWHNCPVCGNPWTDGKEDCPQGEVVVCAECAFGPDPDWVVMAEARWEE